MEFDQPTQRFQQWLGCLDHHQVHAEVDAIEREVQNLQTYRDLLNHALDLKQRCGAWFTAAGLQSRSRVDDPTSTAAVSVEAPPTGEDDTGAPDDSGTDADKAPFSLNSLAARLARERSEPRWRIRARNAAPLPPALEHSAQLAETVGATEQSARDNEPPTTGLPVRVWLDTLEKPRCSDESVDDSPPVPSFELDSRARAS